MMKLKEKHTEENSIDNNKIGSSGHINMNSSQVNMHSSIKKPSKLASASSLINLYSAKIK